MSATTGQDLGRNEPCHCGSGRKYKHCCLEKDEAAERVALAKAADAMPLSPTEPTHQPNAAPPKHATEQPWKNARANVRGFPRFRAPRKVGGS